MGKANTPLGNEDSIFSWLVDATGWKQSQAALLIGAILAVLIILALYWFFGTEIGAAIRATGNNEDMVRALGENTKKIKVIGLALSNGLVGLSGALICQSQKYADVNSGVGAIVIVSGCHRHRRDPAGPPAFLRQQAGRRGRGLRHLFYDPGLCHLAGPEHQRHEADLRGDRCAGAVRSGIVPEVEDPAILCEGRTVRCCEF